MRIPRFVGRCLGWYGNLDAIQKLGFVLGVPSLSGLIAMALAFATRSSDTIIAITAAIWAGALAMAVLMFLWKYIVKPQPLNIEIESKAIGIHSYHEGQPSAPGTGYVGLPDLIILNREPKDVLIRITIRSPKLGTLIPIIEHIGGHVVIDNNQPPHLPTEIPLKPTEHQRGCAEFVVYSGAMREPGFADSSLEGTVVVFTDLLSRRTKETAPLARGFLVGGEFPEPTDATIRFTRQ